MKTNLKQLFLIGATSFLVAGCCTTHHAAQWEYRVVYQNRVGVAYADFAKTQESLMNGLAKDGWIFVSQSDEILCFKRPKFCHPTHQVRIGGIERRNCDFCHAWTA